MNPIDALRLMVKFYPGGVDALAVLVGKSAETLRKELASASGYKLGVADACVISEACIEARSQHCHAYANAVALNCGGFVELKVRDQASGATPSALQPTVALVQHSGNVLAAVTEARADGVMSDNEAAGIKRHAMNVIADMQAVIAEVERENEASHLRPVGGARA